jgi:hypothetical protein
MSKNCVGNNGKITDPVGNEFILGPEYVGERREGGREEGGGRREEGGRRKEKRD